MSFHFTKLDSLLHIGASPVFILLTASLILLMQSVFKSVASEKYIIGVTLIANLLAWFACLQPSLESGAIFLRGSYTTDGLAKISQCLIMLASVATLLMTISSSFLRKHFFRGDIASIYCMAIAGMILMSSTHELMTAFIGLEMASISIYALVGYIDPSRRSQEGAIKYLVIGSLGASILLFGMAILYALTGSLFIPEIVQRLNAIQNAQNNFWIQMSMLMMVSGLGIKLSLVPFHLWSPDAYEAAPTPITALMATAVKTMILIFALRVAIDLQNVIVLKTWAPMFALIAMLSVLIGNIMALVQGSLKRMLAYSSIAHTGYMAFALSALGGLGENIATSSVLLYILGYTIVSLGVFSILCWFENENAQNLHIDDLSGLVKTHPKTAVALAAFMFGLAGLPPASGFILKFFIFQSIIASGMYSLAIAGVLGSSIALYYYLRIIVKMFMSEKIQHGVKFSNPISPVTVGIVSVSLVLMLALGTFLPRYMIDATNNLLSQKSSFPDAKVENK